MKTPVSLPHCANEKVPQPEAPYFHKIPVQVRFSDIDILGHINNSVYLTFFDLAKADYFTTVTGRPVEKGELLLAIVNINCNFYSPGYFREELVVASRVKSISQRAVVLEQRLYNPESGDVKCIATTVMAGFDPATAAGVEIPDEIARQIEAFEERKLKIIHTFA